MSPLGLRTGETPARPGLFHGFSDAGHKSVSSVILSGAEILIGLVLSVYIRRFLRNGVVSTLFSAFQLVPVVSPAEQHADL
jgi:hypothetical protein